MLTSNHTAPKRIAVLWNHVTGYLQASLGALIEDQSVELFVIQNSREEYAEFAPFSHDRCRLLNLDEASGASGMAWLDDLLKFQPELALITGTGTPQYQQAARLLKRDGAAVVWAGDRILRVPLQDTYQMIQGRLFGKWRDYDAAFVPGAAAAKYARWIGFPQSRIFQGLYSCDTTLFQPAGVRRHQSIDSGWPPVFLYVGQFIERKGIITLLKAYTRYRQSAEHPWELWCAGAGPLRNAPRGHEGVKLLDFLSPDELAGTMAQAGALVLPSQWDHWGVVIHEAASAGLPIIASNECGAVLDLVRDGHNGFTFGAGDDRTLARLMKRCSEPTTARIMGSRSLEMSRRFNPALFARLLIDQIPATLGTLRS